MTPIYKPSAEIQAGTLSVADNAAASQNTAVADGANIAYSFPTAFTSAPMGGTAIIQYHRIYHLIQQTKISLTLT